MEGKKCARLYIQVNATIKSNPFNIINMFGSQLVPNILLKDGRKKVCPPIHPGEDHNMIQSIAFKLRHSGFRIQWETLLEWRLPSLTRLKWCQFLSHLRSWLGLMEVFILLFAVQVRFKTTQVESGEVWALCLVRLWTRKNSSTSVWWNLWGTQKIFNWGENLLNYADSESQLPEAC